MPRQVKIGFDKVPTPPVTTYHQLLDVRGTPLTDAAGNPLVTEDAATATSFSLAKNSLSSFVSNSERENNAVPVREAFADASEVSSTLLGVPRAEEQLSLFSDVSTYGFDPLHWNHYRTGHGRWPGEWYTRKHPVFGRRGPAKFYEETNEQALYFRSFPTQYRYPRHPKNSSADITDLSQYPHFRKYMNFIALGRWLYEVWHPVNAEFAEANFLPPVLKILNSAGEEVVIDRDSWTKILPGGFIESQFMFDIVYTSSTNDGSDAVQVAMDYIETWTLFHYKIRRGTDTYPPYVVQEGFTFNNYEFKVEGPGQVLPYVGLYDTISTYAQEQYTRPGGDAENNTIGVLESRKSFRYQPGRVSGFTFGIRLKNNLSSLADKIEWGAANQTDQYMFQAAGPNINIVRRSTVDIPEEVRKGMGFDPDDTDLYSGPELPPSTDNSEPMYTLTIPRNLWNGDTLDGKGPSGHILDPEKVTMYKIEYSWYGAIGAKFYAYVPIENDECRWVLMHTLILENKLVAPVLQNADFKFRYVLNTNNTQDMTEPMWIYKYGSSYYIDGGDEGNITLNSVTSDSRPYVNTTSGGRGSVVGLHTKTKILNSFGSLAGSGNYDGTQNNKKVYPTTLSVFSDSAVRIDINKVRVSPDGHHGSKTVSLRSGTLFEKQINFDIRDREVLANISSAGNNNPITIFDNNAKVIGNGIYNVYLKNKQGDAGILTNEGDIVRRRSDYSLQSEEIGENVLINNEPVEINETDTTVDRPQGFDAKLVGYRSVVASDTPIRANTFKIHFLNPTPRDGRYSGIHWADFAIGVTGDLPSVGDEDQDGNDVGFLKFGADQRVYPKDTANSSVINNLQYFNLEDQLFVEWSNRGQLATLTDKAEYREEEAGEGVRMEQDYRIRGQELPQYSVSPSGSVTTQGVLGCVKGIVETLSYNILSVEDANVVGIPNAKKVIFDTSSVGGVPPVTTKTIGVAELGINDTATGYVAASLPGTTTVTVGQDEVNKIFVLYEPKDGDLNNANTTLLNTVASGGTAQAKIVTLTDDNKLSDIDPSKNFEFKEVFRFNVQPLYLFVAMKSNSRINNIIVEELTASSSTTHIPNFIGDINDTNAQFDIAGYESSNIEIIKDALTETSQSPSNFISNDRLSGIKYDTQTSCPIALDTATKLYSFYVGANESVKFGLENIFNTDREYLTPGLFNNSAIYFSAIPVAENSSANVQMTITSKEQ